jgi:hypothetical protein
VLAQQRWEIGERDRARELAAAARDHASEPGHTTIAGWLAERQP